MTMQVNRSTLRFDARAGGRLSMRAVREALNDIDTTFANVGARGNGLVLAEANRRLIRHGPNEISRSGRVPALLRFLRAFKSPFIAVLFVLALICATTDVWLPMRNGKDTDPSKIIVIAAMILVGACLRFIQEQRSARMVEDLKTMVRPTATVLRRRSANASAEAMEVAMSTLVVGDIVRLSPGDMVPADIRLIHSRDLFVSQTVLTGEASLVEKQASASGCPGRLASREMIDLLALPNICFMGTSVAGGTAMGVVVAAGDRTYYGSLACTLIGSRNQNGCARGLGEVSWLLARLMMALVPIVFLINGLSSGNWLEALLFTVAVAVGLTPELLPVIMSANLARGAIAMARRKVVVKRLEAIQDFGAMDVLCTDKTGTLTQNCSFLQQHVDPGGRSNDAVLGLVWLNSFHQGSMANPIDQAVLRAAASRRDLFKLDYYAKVDEIPFDFTRRRLSVVVRGIHGEHLIVCKGAPEEMLAASTRLRRDGRIAELDEGLRGELLRMARAYHLDGLRVMVVATREIPRDEAKSRYDPEDEKEMVVEGLLTFLDPPKDTARPAIAALEAHGVHVKVLTGDNEITTARICRELGMEPGVAVLGHTLDRLSDIELARLVEGRTLFAKMTPLHKSRVLKALQANGHTVGFMGDGINDAMALRDADIAISVDSGADIARESADVVLLEKNLMVLVEGVVRGRDTFGNILKYLNLTISSNFGNALSLVFAGAFLPFVPMLVIQLLVQNLLYDLAQLALPWDRVDEQFTRRPRKWEVKNIARFALFFGPLSSLFDLMIFAVLWFALEANTIEKQVLFQSGWFLQGLFSQLLIVHVLRTRERPFLESIAALPVLVASCTIGALGFCLPLVPLGTMVGLEPVSATFLPWLVTALAGYGLLAQGLKTIYVRRFQQWF